MPIASHSRFLSSPPPPSLNPQTPNRIQIPNRIGLALQPATSTITAAAGPIRVSRLRPSSSSSSPTMSSPPADAAMGGFAAVANKVADAAGDVIRKYFRQKFDILDKDDLSPVTIADRDAEECMVSIILENFPSHAIFGEEHGWRCKEEFADYVWVLDPIDGTKSFITGKPLFGTLIALLHKGKPVKEPLYGCDCYAYALLASGFVDLVIESGLKPYDFLSLIPVIEGAGGSITDWKGNRLHWEASADSLVTSFNVAAAGDPQLHKEVLEVLQWK